MKKTQFILLGVIIFILSSFTIFEITGNDEKKFIGSWEGSEKDNQKVGLTKHWIQNRYKDGAFVLIFTTLEDCQVEHMTERGKWYIKEGLFYEKHNDGKTDVYSYEIPIWRSFVHYSGARLRRVPTYGNKQNKAFATRVVKANKLF
jgi:hypothetical protein